jgi:hypothetical protein
MEAQRHAATVPGPAFTVASTHAVGPISIGVDIQWPDYPKRNIRLECSIAASASLHENPESHAFVLRKLKLDLLNVLPYGKLYHPMRP